MKVISLVSLGIRDTVFLNDVLVFRGILNFLRLSVTAFAVAGVFLAVASVSDLVRLPLRLDRERRERDRVLRRERLLLLERDRLVEYDRLLFRVRDETRAIYYSSAFFI